MPQEPVHKRAIAFVDVPGGPPATVVTAEEKGIDVRIAIDVIRFALRDAYDVAIVFSQDQDLSELCEEIRMISKEQNRWIKIASAFPDSAAAKNHRGIPRSDWVRITRDIYDGCLDFDDHRRR